jgi:8-oxo-dGTP pyrophosphatase MutT (NUDIX family)
MANPVGVSTALETCDGWLLLGRRNDSVAYYPNRVHPFAGALEPAEPLDVFAEVRRELSEELAMTADNITDMQCIGMVEDLSLRQPELIFHVLSSRSRRQIEAKLDATEHAGVYAIRTADLRAAKTIDDPILTPVAAASLVLWKR